MESDFGQNRRYFPRVKLRAHATLIDSKGREWPVHLLDLSFNGALAALIHSHNLNAGESVSLLIEDDAEGATPVRMQGRLSHIKEHFLGLECRATGIDNQTHLRELLKRSQRQQSSLPERSYASMLRDYQTEEKQTEEKQTEEKQAEQKESEGRESEDREL